MLDLVDRLPAALAEAFTAAELPPEAIVCVRRVHTDVRLDSSALGSPEATLQRWAGRLAAAILRDCERSVSGRRPAPSCDALVFADLQAAFADAIAGALRGELANRWAWRRAGVVVESDPVAAPALLARVLSRAPRFVPAVLGDPSTVPALVQWSWADWCAAAQRYARGHDTAADAGGDRSLRRARLSADSQVRRVLAAAVAARRRHIALPDAGDQAVAVGAEGVDARAVARLVLAGTAPELAGDAAAIAVVRAALTSRPDGDVVPTSIEPAPSAPADTTRVARPDPAAHTDHAADDAEAETALAPGSAPEPDVAPTAVGGLLFLLPLVLRLGWPQRLGDGELAVRPLAEVLAELGVRLSGSERTDPAVLAFAGRMWPRRLPRPAPFNEHETAVLDGLVAEIDRNLAALLPSAARRHGTALRRFVIDRAALLSGEPGWIEATFAAESADAEIRRAGLDLDPGWITELGCVLRYRYV